MPRPGITITTSASAASATVGQRLGTWFVAAQTQRGPSVPDPTRPLRSLSDFVTVYGGRDATVGSTAATYDALEAFWRAGGGPVLLARVVGPGAAVASKTLQDRAGTPVNTLSVRAKGPGAWGNSHLTVSVTNGSGGNTFLLVVLVDGVAVETSPDLSSPTDAVTWSVASQYVNVVDLASATAAPNNIPAVIGAQSFTSGADDLPSVTDTQWTNALNTLSQAWGPGLVSKIGITTSSGHAGTMQHAYANNRMAILDGPAGATQSTLTTLATTVAGATVNPEYGALMAPWVLVPPFAGGTTTRLIAPSSIAAGLISRQVTTGSANIAAAGSNGAAAYVLDVQTIFTDAELDTLNGPVAVNPLKRPYSASATPSVELYGYNTLGSVQGGWRQMTAQLLRLQLIDEFRQAGEAFLFDQIDGRGQKAAEFGGTLGGILQEHYDDGELFGGTAAQAYAVDVGPGVNTPDSIAAGQLKARVTVRVSPYGEFVSIDVVKFAANSSLAT